MFSHGSVKSRLLAHTKTIPTSLITGENLKSSTTHQKKKQKNLKKKSKNFADGFVSSFPRHLYFFFKFSLLHDDKTTRTFEGAPEKNKKGHPGRRSS